MEKAMTRQKTTPDGIIFMLCSALFASAGQVLFKFAANNTSDIITFFVNPFLYIGGTAYLVGLLFMIKSLRRGELSVVYPMLATSFIWVSIASLIFFDTDFMTPQKWIGVSAIVFGIYLVGKGREA